MYKIPIVDDEPKIKGLVKNAPILKDTKPKKRVYGMAAVRKSHWKRKLVVV